VILTTYPIISLYVYIYT